MTFFGGNDPRKSDSERLVTLEVKVEYLFYAVAGLYIGLFALAALIIVRTGG